MQRTARQYQDRPGRGPIERPRAEGRARGDGDQADRRAPQAGGDARFLLALHAAGYRAVLERLGPGRLLDVGCGQGFESVGFVAPGRQVVGVDYSAEATATASARFGGAGLEVASMDAQALGLATGPSTGSAPRT